MFCFAHPHYPAVARVFVGPHGRLEWLPVCQNCAANHRRAGHELVPV
jgi:hypothetical protein